MLPKFAIKPKMNVCKQVAIPVIKKMLAMCGYVAKLFAVNLFGSSFESTLRRSDDQFLSAEPFFVVASKSMDGVSFGHWFL